MNIIKFRVWDKLNKRFISPSESAVTGTGNLIITPSGYYEEFTNQNDCDFIIQQFTGMKDVNDKEIYDGDLILGDGYGPYRVFWAFGGWCSCCFSDAELIYKYKRIEVVGHVFDGTKYEGEQ